MMRRYRAGWQCAVGAAFLALVLGACGGGDGALEATPTPAGFLEIPDPVPTLPNLVGPTPSAPTPTIVAPGTVTEKDGKKWIAATKMEAPKS